MSESVENKTDSSDSASVETNKTKEAKKKDKASKKSWWKGMKAEFKKIIWPDNVSAAKKTTAVIIISIILGCIIKVLDMAIQFGLSFVI